MLSGPLLELTSDFGEPMMQPLCPHSLILANFEMKAAISFDQDLCELILIHDAPNHCPHFRLLVPEVVNDIDTSL